MESANIDSENEGLAAPPAVPVNVYDNFTPELRTYNQDGLITMHDCSFMSEPRFAEAYRTAQETGSWTGPWGQAQIHWRAHVLCWAGATVNHLPGDFVECGVNRGGTAMLLLTYLNLHQHATRRMFLYDTFYGLDPTLSSETELENLSGIYSECFADVSQQFAPFPNVLVQRGSIPESLIENAPDQVAFLHLDLNAAIPERKAIEFFWERLIPGGVVVLDDYAWVSCHEQKLQMDDFARRVHGHILSLPTGQGMLIKPCPVNALEHR